MSFSGGEQRVEPISGPVCMDGVEWDAEFPLAEVQESACATVEEPVPLLPKSADATFSSASRFLCNPDNKLVVEALARFQTLVNEERSGEKIPQHFIELILLVPEKTLELFAHFNHDEIRVLIEDRIRTEEDLDAILEGHDVIAKLKTLYEQFDAAKTKEKKATEGWQENPLTYQWTWFLKATLPENPFLTTYKKEFSQLLDRFGSDYFRTLGEFDRNSISLCASLGLYHREDRERLSYGDVGNKFRHLTDNQIEPKVMERAIGAFFARLDLKEDLLETAKLAAFFFNRSVEPEEAAQSFDMAKSGLCSPVESQSPDEAWQLLLHQVELHYYNSDRGKLVRDFIAANRAEVAELLALLGPNATERLLSDDRFSMERLHSILANSDVVMKMHFFYHRRAGLTEVSRDSLEVYWPETLLLFPNQAFFNRYREPFLQLLDRFGESFLDNTEMSPYGYLCSPKVNDDDRFRKAAVFFEVAHGIQSEEDLKGLAYQLFGGGGFSSDQISSDQAEQLLQIAKGCLSEAHESWFGSKDWDEDEKQQILPRLYYVLLHFHSLFQKHSDGASVLMRFLLSQCREVGCLDGEFFKRLEGLLYKIPEQYLDQHPEIIINIVGGASLVQAGEILITLGRIPYSPTVNLFSKLVGNAETDAGYFLAYLDLIKAPESVLQELIKEKQVSILPLLLDYRTDRDLHDVRLSDVAIYAALFEALGNSGRFDEAAGVLSQLRWDQIAVELAGRNLVEQARIIQRFALAVHPDLVATLNQKFIRSQVEKTGVLSGLLQNWYQPKNGRLSVTQYNIADINTLLKILLELGRSEEKPPDLYSELAAVFGGIAPHGSFREQMEWLVNQFDVEEMKISRITSLGLVAEYLELQSTLRDLYSQANVRYLNNNFGNIDFMKIFLTSNSLAEMIDVKKLESVRRSINASNRMIGDLMIDELGTRFLESNPASLENLPTLLAFSRAWVSIPDEGNIDRDVKGLYQQYGYFGFGMVADFVRSEVEHGRGDALGIDLDPLIAELEGRGYPIQKQGNIQKGLNRVASHPHYVARKTWQMLTGGDSEVTISADIRLQKINWSEHPGVQAVAVLQGGVEVAKLILADPKNIRVKVLVEKSGVVAMKKVAADLGDRYVFSAPLSFTTGERKLTELAFRDGEQMNWLLSPSGKDGLLVVGRGGIPKILDKRGVRLGDLMDESDLSDPEIKKLVEMWLNGRRKDFKDLKSVLKETIEPFRKIRDRGLFLKILQHKQDSLLCNLLLINGDEVHSSINDGADSRRFFITFPDGRFGVIDSTTAMSTGDLVQLAKEVGVEKAIYMDTGMFDMATYRDGGGVDHILGHQDTDESTNRVVIYLKAGS